MQRIANRFPFLWPFKKLLNSQFSNSVLRQFHEEIEDETNEPGIIVQEVQPGYMFGERLLRPSFVGVSKKKDQKKEDKKQDKTP